MQTTSNQARGLSHEAGPSNKNEDYATMEKYLKLVADSKNEMPQQQVTHVKVQNVEAAQQIGDCYPETYYEAETIQRKGYDGTIQRRHNDVTTDSNSSTPRAVLVYNLYENTHITETGENKIHLWRNNNRTPVCTEERHVYIRDQLKHLELIGGHHHGIFVSQTTEDEDDASAPFEVGKLNVGDKIVSVESSVNYLYFYLVDHKF